MGTYIHHWFTASKKSGGIHRNAVGTWCNNSDGAVATIIHKWDVEIDDVEIGIGLPSLKNAEMVAAKHGATEYWNGQRNVKIDAEKVGV